MTRQVPLSRPGEVLLKDFLKPLAISQAALAKAIDVPPTRISEIVHGKRAISADTAVRLGAYFGTDAQSWMNLQSHYDTEIAREQLADVLKNIQQHGVHA
jgi:antitoxin HigA-1